MIPNILTTGWNKNQLKTQTGNMNGLIEAGNLYKPEIIFMKKR